MAFAAVVMVALPAVLPAMLAAQEPAGRAAETLDTLFARLAMAEGDKAARIAERIRLLRGQSGSAALDLLLRHGRAAMERGDVRIATEHFTALVDHAPDFAEAWYARAGAYAAAGDIGAAFGDLQRALQLDPRHFDALRDLGVLLQYVDRPQAAQAALEASQRLYPQPEAQDALRRLERMLQKLEA